MMPSPALRISVWLPGALKDSELEQGVVGTVIANDGIAVIVNNENTVTGLTSEQVKGIYMGELTNWSEVA